MKPLLWAAAAGATTATVLLIMRGSRTPSTSIPGPAAAPKLYGEATSVPLSVPAGWRRVSSAEVSALPELAAHATAVMNTPGFTSMPYGTLSPFVASDGKTYATWIEQHYHPPGGSTQPWGLHHGVTVLAQV